MGDMFDEPIMKAAVDQQNAQAKVNVREAVKALREDLANHKGVFPISVSQMGVMLTMRNELVNAVDLAEALLELAKLPVEVWPTKDELDGFEF